eukprot:CAMPEP_0119565872 /NCGR_PEP_ID=MMETSP1352-20130426/31399_1 /TAXON_ID=265584 /ORGANISM="Stauroneis constricta, Strain CCMP1120" /LENGTH=129 /DNA_ID=CAMNT_0007614881 /DNA_START=114 /DNA_END=499 /DNA_ORIENTATION=+
MTGTSGDRNKTTTAAATAADETDPLYQNSESNDEEKANAFDPYFIKSRQYTTQDWISLLFPILIAFAVIVACAVLIQQYVFGTGASKDTIIVYSPTASPIPSAESKTATAATETTSSSSSSSGSGSCSA